MIPAWEDIAWLLEAIPGRLSSGVVVFDWGSCHLEARGYGFKNVGSLQPVQVVGFQ